MKTAVYLSENTTQLVIHPENEWERSILKMVHQSLPEKTYWGEFYECQGGWVRHSSSPGGDSSLIIRISQAITLG